MIKNYFKIALRSFWKHKLFTLINVIGLSIGISAAVVIYLIVNYDFTFDKFHKDTDRIYRIVSNFSFQGDVGHNPGVCGPLAGAVKTQVTGVEITAPMYTMDANPDVFIAGKSNVPVRFKKIENVTMADDGYFKLFNYKWLAGSHDHALSQPNQVVLTSDQAKLYFPKLSYDQMIGKIVTYDTIKTTVTGIVETLKENTDFTFHDFISYSTSTVNKDLADQVQVKEWRSTTSASVLFIKLSPQAAPSHIEKQLNDLLKKNNPPKPENRGKSSWFSLQRLDDLHFSEIYGNFDDGHTASKTTLYFLLGIAAFLLILGCINFINLTTAQAIQRAKEIGIRKTMGSTRLQLVVQFLSETFLITLFAVVVAVGLTPLIIKLFSSFISSGVKTDFIHHPSLLLFLLILTVVVSVLSGFYPAILLSGYKPVLVLKNQASSNRSQTRNAWLRKSLTVTQFVIAQFFIMATLLVSKQIYYALHKDLGFKKDAIINIHAPWKNGKESLNAIYLQKLKALPQVAMVGVANAPPSSDMTQSTDVTYMDGKKEVKTDLEMKFTDENYLKIYHIKLLAGRNLQPSDTASAFLINNTYAKIIGFKEPHSALGKIVKENGKSMMIVGVVADFYAHSIHSPVKPLAILVGNGKYQTGSFQIALKPQTANGGEWKKAIAGMGAAWKELYPDDDFEYHFYDEDIAKFYDKEQNTSKLLTWATGLSIFISCLGLLGLAIYTTNQRTKEIGVRKVLGATVTQIVTLLSAELILLTLLAFAIVTPLAWLAMNKWMEGFSDRTSISWWIFAASGTAMLAAAIFTSAFQTVKAAIANPVKSLRSE
jgi:ABC-type antimicrobial peptide transport system permease subunit